MGEIKNKLLLSLCIPTNGIPELVFPVLDSIYSQSEVNMQLYEVVVMDNGNNEDFKIQMKTFVSKYENLVYKQTDAKGFLSESECYKAARGVFIKFINHRTKLLDGTLKYLIDFIEKNKTLKPCVYFSNGVIRGYKGVSEFSNFDDYVKGLGYWSSWSTGMGFWKEDFDRIPKDVQFNELYPHTTILFNERNKSSYLIDNNVLLYEIPVNHANKGRYNLFYAFGVEYIGIICDLLRDNSINIETFLSVKNDNLKFVASLYLDFVILKQPCSYNLSQGNENLDVFYGHRLVQRIAFMFLFIRILKFPYRIIRKILKIQ